VYADAPYPVVEVAIAGAQGRNQAVAFAALKYGKSDHDVYAFYTTDLGSTWGGYWMDTDNQDSRLPRVSSDGVQFDAGASAVFYFIEYYDRENDGLGNIKFLMCPVGDIAERSNWRLPNGSSLDSLVISNESLYGVEPVRGCLSLSSRSESGGTMPVVVWNTPCISLSGDVYFVRPMAPVYMGAEEEDGHAQEIRVFFVPAERALRIDGDLHGETRLRLYSVDGRLVASLGLSPEGKTTTVKLPDLPEGVYLWRILQTGGRVSVIR
ncbi:MAG: T9SS type A sorting domain-containing protein, partial [Candidatus Hydrothermia bacterium]